MERLILRSDYISGLSDPSWKVVVGAIVAAVAVHSFVRTLTTWFRYRNKALPPFYYETPYLPWFGSLLQFATGPREFLQRASAASSDGDGGGGVFTIQLFGKSMTFLTGSDGHEHFFRARESEFDIREAYAMTVITFGPGVCYDCPQSKMAQQFAFFKDGLSDAKFVRYMELVQEEAASFFDEHWGRGEGEADLLQSLSDLYTLTSSRCLLGDEVRERWTSSGMAEHYLALDHSFVPILFFFPWIPNPHRSKCVAARKFFTEMFADIMEERRHKKRTDPDYEPPSDFVEVLTNAKYRDGTSPSPTEITGILVATLLGGQHTSNVTSTWLMAHLLKDETWLEKVLDEQRVIFDGRKQKAKSNCTSSSSSLYPATLTYDEVSNQMPVFDQVLSETLRLHPPFFQLSRTVKKETTFRGKTIPVGHIVNISPGAAHRLPELWGEDADRFDPDRFTAENKAKHPKYAWIPFGGGMHQCGGRKFAWNSLKVSLSWLLRNYEIEFVGKGASELPREDYTTMVVAPTKQHCRVRYRRRTVPVC